ncbi:hypothetical protein Angca_006197, partial [Angiostrongylus cantonensis]
DDVITDEDVADGDDSDTSRINTAHYDGEKTTITISTEAAMELYQHWLDQAVSGLMAAVATDKMSKVSEHQRAAHQACAKSAKTVQQHAKCVVVLLDLEEKYQRWDAKFGNSKRIEAKPVQKKPWQKGKLERCPEKKSWKKGEVEERVQKKTWTEGKMTEAVQKRPWKKKLEGRFEKKPWQKGKVEEQIREKLLQKEKIRTEIQKKPLKKSSTVVGAKKPFQKIRRHPVWHITGRNITKKYGPMKKMDVLGEDEEDDMEMLIKEKKQEKKLTDEEKMMQAPVKLIRQGMLLHNTKISFYNAEIFARPRTAGVCEKNVKMISPRLLSLVPDEIDNETINLLSPSLFALHDQGRGIEEKLSLAKAMKYFDEHGHQEWLNFVVEASGVSDALKKIREMNAVDPSRRMDEQFRGDNGQPLYFTKENVTKMFGQTERRKIEVFEQLQRSLTPQQMLEMNTTGYVVMDAEQLKLIYGVNSPYGNSSTHERLKNVSSHEVPGIIHHIIRGLADETLAFRVHRERDVVLAPLLLTSVISNPGLTSQPLVLSPAVLVPVILSPAIFGAVILSPWIFVPVIVAPRLMSPVVLSPVVLSPLILSPLALDPLILSPGALLPFILTPSVLSPFILSPVALTPLILSPFCLTPFIVIPNVLSPLILSPFVLSPIILSPVALSAFVLSPYALSPVISSPGFFFSAILSPTWLS